MANDEVIRVDEIAISDDEIRLGQFLKLANLVGNGSEARPLLADGVVTVNGELESRRGRRLHPGDVVAVAGVSVRVIGGARVVTATPFELGDAGPMRDRLVAAALRGEKTATSSLEVFYTIERLALPKVGDVAVLVGSDDEPLGLIEIVQVEVLPIAAVSDEIAVAEGEGFDNAVQWRAAHEHYWEGSTEAVRVHLSDPSWSIRDDTPVVVEWFRIVPPDETTTQ